ncbi:hypothetical protein BDE02_15G125100 [Populus trichocarpa]|nr:hypothetical protein BDE02_15G125100 [Populus trichocarpa]
MDAADEVIDSIDKDELAKFFSLKSDPEDEETEKKKKAMETTRDELAEALYQKGLALVENESLKYPCPIDRTRVLVSKSGLDRQNFLCRKAETEGTKDLFEDNFKGLQKWVDAKSSKYGTLLVLRERRRGRLGAALKALNEMMQDNGDPPKKKLYELKLSLLDEIGWKHLSTYEKEWMLVRFPPSLPLF